MGEISFEEIISGKKFDKDGNLVNEYDKHVEGEVDFKNIAVGKICIDANIMTLAITNQDFRKLLIKNKGDNLPYTTEDFRRECIGNLTKIFRNHEKAKEEFELFEKDIGLKYCDFKEEYYKEGVKLFSDVINSGIKIKKKSTFLVDCVNLITIYKNGINVLFSNDEDLQKVCKNFLKSIEIIPLAQDDRKIIKDFFKHQRKHRKAKK